MFKYSSDKQFNNHYHHPFCQYCVCMYGCIGQLVNNSRGNLTKTYTEGITVCIWETCALQCNSDPGM